jgi:flagellar hook-associated protein 3 FlgL
MRISSQQMFDAGVKSIQDHAGDTMKYQTQISSGKKYQNVSDNPADIGLGMKYAFDKAQFEMFQNNQKLMTDRTNVIEAQLGSIYSAMASMKQVVAQSSGASGQSDLSALGQKVRSLKETIISFASANDATGRPILKALTSSSDQLTKVKIEPNVEVDEGVSLAESMGKYSSIAGASVEYPKNSASGTLDSFSAGATVITGTGTKFRSELAIGQKIYNSSGNLIGIVASFDPDPLQEKLTLAAPAAVGSGTGSFTLSKTVDVIAILNMVDAALNGNPPTVPSAYVAASLDTAVTQVRAAQVKAGLMSKVVASSQDAVETKMGNLENSRAVLLDTDIAEASANLSRSQTLLQAAQNIFAKLQTSSLFDKL